MTRKKIIVIVGIFLAFAGLIACNRIRAYQGITRYFEGMNWNTNKNKVEDYAYKWNSDYIHTNVFENGIETDTYSFASSKYSKYGNSYIVMNVQDGKLRRVDVAVTAKSGAAGEKLYKKYYSRFKKQSKNVATDEADKFGGSNSDTVYYIEKSADKVVFSYSYKEMEESEND